MPCFYSQFSEIDAKFCLPALISEKSNIAAKALMAYYKLRGNNYVFTGQNLDVCNPKFKYSRMPAHIGDMHVNDFVSEMCIIGDPNTVKCHTITLHKAYMQYCIKNSYQYYENQRSFTAALKRCCKHLKQSKKWRDKRENGENRYGFEGIQLKTMPLVKTAMTFNV